MMHISGFQKIKRVGQILRILSKYGFDEIVSRSNLDRILPDSFLFWNNNARRAFQNDFNVRMRMAIEELGPTFIKLGQMLSNRPDIIPKDLQVELIKLQDDVALEDIDVRAMLRDELDLDVDEHFAWIQSEPLASASIAQVYRARLSDGQEVVLKIRRKEIEEIIHAD